MATIFRGTTVRDAAIVSMKQDIASLHIKPQLVIFQVGNKDDANTYIRQKKLFAENIGALIEHIQFPESVTEHELVAAIEQANKSADVHGIILQMPVPAHLNKKILIDTIDPKKDVDGLTSYNAALLYANDPSGIMPATARGILKLLDYYKVDVDGKHVVVVGRSALVGKPTALALLNRNATVTITHRHTKHLAKLTQAADILVIAAGKPEFITKQYVSSGQIVIDVGITAIEKGGVRKMYGDCAYFEVEPIVEAITPVPGGVGPMTVTALFENLLQAYRLQLVQYSSLK